MSLEIVGGIYGDHSCSLAWLASKLAYVSIDVAFELLTCANHLYIWGNHTEADTNQQQRHSVRGIITVSRKGLPLSGGVGITDKDCEIG